MNEKKWNDGILEYWNDGHETGTKKTTKDGYPMGIEGFRFLIPTFHYSNIPSNAR